MSDELKRFFREIHEWINDGCPEHKIFDRRHSLCFASERFLRLPLHCGYSAIRAAQEEMSALFKQVDCEDFTFPFNTCPRQWMYEMANGYFYQNPKRLAFIEEHAK